MMLHITDTGRSRASLIWSVAAMVTRTRGSFADLRAELRETLGRDPELTETQQACRLAREDVTASGREDDSVGA